MTQEKELKYCNFCAGTGYPIEEHCVNIPTHPSGDALPSKEVGVKADKQEPMGETSTHADAKLNGVNPSLDSDSHKLSESQGLHEASISCENCAVEYCSDKSYVGTSYCSFTPKLIKDKIMYTAGEIYHWHQPNGQRRFLDAEVFFSMFPEIKEFFEKKYPNIRVESLTGEQK